MLTICSRGLLPVLVTTVNSIAIAGGVLAKFEPARRSHLGKASGALPAESYRGRGSPGIEPEMIGRVK